MIYLIGAGAMGCLWAACLAQAQQHACFLLARDYALAKGYVEESASSQLADRPLALPPRNFSFQATDVAAHTQLSIPQIIPASALEDDSILLLCTKSYAALDALRAFESLINPSHKIVLFQNGLGSQQEICDHFSDIPSYAAVTTEAANLPEPSKLIHAATGTTAIGALNSAAEARGETSTADLVRQLSRSGLRVALETDIWSRLWQKLVINCAINPFTAIAGCRNGEVPNTNLFKSLWPQLKIELEALMELAGYPRTGQQIEALALSVMHDTRNNLSSMLQDRLANRATEIDYINGFAMRYLKKHHRECVANQQLVDQVHALRD